MLREASTHEGVVDLAWLVEALECARAEGQDRVLSDLEAVRDDVLFEMELTSRHA